MKEMKNPDWLPFLASWVPAFPSRSGLESWVYAGTQEARKERAGTPGKLSCLPRPNPDNGRSGTNSLPNTCTSWRLRAFA